MKEFFHSIKFKILVGILILLTGFMLYAASTEGFDTIPSKVIGFIVTPVQKLSASISGAATDFFGKFVRADEIAKENEELKKQLDELNQKLVDFEKYQNQNNQYKEFLGIKEENPEFVFEEASVVSRDPNSRFGNFTIDKGSLQGISQKDLVITPSGLVGEVTKVGYTYSHVKTILDPAMGITCVASRTGDTGVLTGALDLAGQGKTKMMYISKDSGITLGDIIKTAGSELYPKGLIIGTVSQVKSDPNGVSLYVEIDPPVALENVKDVFVIKSFYGQAEQPQS